MEIIREVDKVNQTDIQIERDRETELLSVSQKLEKRERSKGERKKEEKKELSREREKNGERKTGMEEMEEGKQTQREKASQIEMK